MSSELSSPIYPLARGAGIIEDNVQRVVLASNSPGVGGSGASFDQNLIEVKGVAISTGAGSNDAGTLRVCLSAESAVTLQTDQVNLNTDQLEGLATAGNASLTSIDGKLTSQATAANQSTANTTLSSIDTKLSSQATAANQSTANTSLSSIDTKLSSQATAANQSTANTSLSSIDTKLSSQATAANQSTANTSLSAINTKLPSAVGAQTIAASLAVNIASDQVVPVSATALPLPSGAATSANQTTELASLSSIDSKATTANASLSSIDGKITAVNTGAVVVSSSALPSGAATAGNQTTANTTLSTISGKLPAALGTQTTSASLAVNIASDQTVPVGGTVAHDGVASGNPVATGLLASSARPTAVSNDGDVARITGDRYGRLRTVGIDCTVAVLDATASGDTVLIAAPGASLKLKIIKVECTNTNTGTPLTAGLKSTSVAGGAVFSKKYLPAAGGQGVMNIPGNHILCGTNEALSVNLSVAGNVSFTAYYETVDA